MDAANLGLGRAVRVLWRDSAYVGGWRQDAKAVPQHIVSIGFVVESNDEALAVTTSMGDDYSAHCPLSIPWQAVVSYALVGDEWDRNPK